MRAFCSAWYENLSRWWGKSITIARSNKTLELKATASMPFVDAPHGHHHRPCHRSCIPYANTHTISLARRGEVRPWSGCETRCTWASPYRNTSDLVPQVGHVRRKLENWDAQWIFNRSMPMPHVRHPIPSHSSTKPALCHTESWRQCSTPGTGTTACHYMQTTSITPHSSRQRAAAGTALHRRATSHPENQVYWRHLATGWLHGGEFLPSRQLARRMRPERHNTESWQVCVLSGGITMNNVCPCNKYLQAIREFPTPRNITDIRSWFGLVDQVSYGFSMAERLLPFRELLKPGNAFARNDELEDIFDKARSTCLATDWSKDGIGFCMFQKHYTCPGTTPFCCRDGWNISLVGSRFTHAAESQYAPIEGEALAVADALDKARFVVLGM